MTRRARKSDCPIHFALTVFGDAWTLLIIRDLMFKGRSSYTEFLRAEEGIATNVLADRLARLEEDEVIERVTPGEGREAKRYRLTPKGVDLLPVMLDLIDWSAKHDPDTAVGESFVRRLRRDRAGVEQEFRARLLAAVSPAPEKQPPATKGTPRELRRKTR
jgi:DNA-binding HxlR family transcriptional regulator